MIVKSVFSILFAVLLLAGYILLIEQIPAGGLVCLIVAVVAVIIALIGGLGLPLVTRVFITGVVIEMGYSMCLAGRTMQPGLTRYTGGMALLFFALYALLPLGCLFRIWPRRLAIPFFCATLPVCFAAANAVASWEERAFVERYHETGVGPTPRWTVSNHWLAYNAERKELQGSD